MSNKTTEPAAPEPLGDSEGTATQVVAGLDPVFQIGFGWLDTENIYPSGSLLYSAATVERLVQERDDYRAALEICKTEMQGDKWDALYIDTVLAKYSEDAIEQASRLV